MKNVHVRKREKEHIVPLEVLNVHFQDTNWNKLDIGTTQKSNNSTFSNNTSTMLPKMKTWTQQCIDIILDR